MDEEDRAWLQLMNEKRSVDGLAGVEMENFELLMDRLEKESFFQVMFCSLEFYLSIYPSIYLFVV